jgi:DNA-directed RNA polymerase subunit M/transcription elongation factor TFIIS
MICSRCGELLIEDRFMDWAARWRCMKCGQVHDSNNVKGHIVNEQKRIFPKSSEPDYFDDEVHLGSESFVRHV